MGYKGEIEPAVVIKEPAQIVPKWYKYKVTVHLADDRDEAIRVILAHDPDAYVNPQGSWRFRVKTKLTYAEVFKALIERKSIKLDTIRKAWWV